MPVTLPPQIADPLKVLLQEDAQPLVNDAMGGVEQLALKTVAALPAQVRPLASVGASVFTSVVGTLLTGWLNIVLAHNAHATGSATAPLPTPAPVPVEPAPEPPSPEPSPPQ